jgi:hypothetical protein
MARRSMFGGLTAVGGACGLVLGLAIIDDRVRDQLARLLSGGGPTRELASAGGRAQELTEILVDAVRDQSIEHAPLVIFALAAMLLVLFMIRT